MQENETYSPREREIMLLASEGFADKEIASRLGISHSTVTTYWTRVRRKCDASSRSEALMKILGTELREVAARAEQALEDLEVIIEQAQDYAIFSIAPDGKILNWNNGVGRILAYTEEEFVGQDFSLVFIPEDLVTGEPEVEMSNARERGRYLDKRWHRRKDGTQIWVDGCIVALRDKVTGELRRYAKIMRDDTERKALEEEVERLQARIRQLTLGTEDAPPA
ncbi:MAG: PAS domain S-box protein [Fimbriimonas sp.]